MKKLSREENEHVKECLNCYHRVQRFNFDVPKVEGECLDCRGHSNFVEYCQCKTRANPELLEAYKAIVEVGCPCPSIRLDCLREEGYVEGCVLSKAKKYVERWNND